LRPPVRVIILGLFPTLFTTICKAVCNPAGLAGVRTAGEQLREYPKRVVRGGEKASLIFSRLSGEWGVEVRMVQALSPMGIWLSLRHRLGQGLWVIINNSKVVDAEEADPDMILREVLTLRESRTPAPSRTGLGQVTRDGG
jgi:hypothetical protein